ncbi:LysR family transcriptional regulator [Isoptericola cucumis]|uniref:LysR family transcriptional regulator n=1 Tax=Isoptericola cucumis TaxID=1776856 RepID=UPI001E60104A|nr:LysR substrate-binding domain-containing protein [Isoptericola cucumis]
MTRRRAGREGAWGVELREIEIFLNLAEELHFGRTAERLHVSVSRVSQSIRKSERMIGAPLFERTSRKVELTTVGEVLQAGLRPAYEGIGHAVSSASAAARRMSGTLALGFMGAQAHQLEPVLARFRARHPDAELRYHEVVFSDPFSALRRGDIDVLTTWLPVDEPDITVGPVLRTEPLRLLVAAGHPLAAAGRAQIEALAGLAIPAVRGDAPASWLDGVLLERTPAGREIPRGPAVTTYQEVLTLVAAGKVVCPVPDEGRRYFPWPGVVYLPLDGAAPVRWALVWRASDSTPLVRAFVAETQRAMG